jgi:hypothetical protein
MWTAQTALLMAEANQTIENREASVVKQIIISRISVMVEQEARKKGYGVTYIAARHELPFLLGVAELIGSLYGYNVKILRNGLVLSWARIDIKV